MEENVKDKYTATDAFESKLKSLCLSDFPCGRGTWPLTLLILEAGIKQSKHSKENPLRITYGRFPPKYKSDKIAVKFLSTTRDYGARHEMVENLEDLLKSEMSPWVTDQSLCQHSWSKNIPELRLKAVKNPEFLASRGKLFNFFTDLWLIDCGVEELDEEILVFHNLCSLNLSANKLTRVNSEYLPRALKVLELAGNNIEDVEALSSCPPLLNHLGLAYNRITDIHQHLKGHQWCELRSLDLSYNDLTDIESTVSALSSLPLLQNLLLIGNPFVLVPVYRGYVIDCLAKLVYLDDETVTIDERYYYTGIKYKLCYNNVVTMTLEIPLLKGIPMPEELKPAENVPEYPKILRKFFLMLSCIPEKEEQKQVPTQTTKQENNETQEQITSPPSPGESPQSKNDKKNKNSEKSERKNSPKEKPEPKGKQKEKNKADGVKLKEEEVKKEEDVKDEQQQEPVDRENCLCTEKRDWSQEMSLEWCKVISRTDLLKFRDFMLRGLNVRLIEEKITLSLPEPEVPSIEEIETKKSKSSKSNKKKEKEELPKKTKKKDMGKGRPATEPPAEIIQSEPVYTTLACLKLPLAGLLGHQYQITDTLTMDWPEPEIIVPTNEEPPPEDKEPSDKKSKNKKKGAAEKKSSKKEVKGADKSPKKSQNVDKKVEEEPPKPLDPLKIYISASLRHFTSSSDADRAYRLPLMDPTDRQGPNSPEGPPETHGGHASPK